MLWNRECRSCKYLSRSGYTNGEFYLCKITKNDVSKHNDLRLTKRGKFIFLCSLDYATQHMFEVLGIF